VNWVNATGSRLARKASSKTRITGTISLSGGTSMASPGEKAPLHVHDQQGRAARL
jgi:hypothetical protein